MIGILNYGNGNIYNLHKLLNKISSEKIKLINSNKDLLKCKKLFLPGVGHYEKSIDQIKKNNLDNGIKDLFHNSIPIFAICIGFHLLGNSSQESPRSKGLGLLNFSVKKIPSNLKLKIPNVNWINVKKNNKNYKFYFTHSYYVEKINNNIVDISYANYGKLKFISSLKYKNLIATQFHPELSGEDGKKVIKSFLNV